ncbi:MAG: RNase adapter RapZ [Erysipelotrichia bacterium]|nr:RNase adapter RapZ [Erysipelotrichia bacterium]
MIEVVFLTGPSGSGKTTAQHVFEESGYYVIDNIFTASFEPIMNEILTSHEKYKKILISVSPKTTFEIIPLLKKIKAPNLTSRMIVLDCKKDILLTRYKLTRHVHPLTTITNMSLEDALEDDAAYIRKIKDDADVIIDTTSLGVKDFRKILFETISLRNKDNVRVRFISFGHKYLAPMDCDLFLDTRAIPNPYWDPKLRKFSGLDKEIIDYLESIKDTNELLGEMIDYLDCYLKKVQADGRGDYCVGICCSGGQHRSVYFAERLKEHFAKKYETSVFHRDITKKEGT